MDSQSHPDDADDGLDVALEEALADGSVLANPLAPHHREAARDVALALSRDFQADLHDGVSQEQLDDLGLSAEEAHERLLSLVSDWRSYADAIVRDYVPFTAAAELRSLLSDLTEAWAKEASAALDEACEQAVPLRMKALVRRREELLDERGWDITTVGGRGEPLPLPAFAYTSGLTVMADHPELVIVGIAPRLADALLSPLCEQIVAGQRRVEPNTDLDEVLANDYKVRAVPCPDDLRRELRLARLENGDAPEALQLLLPDEAGRFPGEPGCEEMLASGQAWPAYGDPNV